MKLENELENDKRTSLKKSALKYLCALGLTAVTFFLLPLTQLSSEMSGITTNQKENTVNISPPPQIPDFTREEQEEFIDDEIKLEPEFEQLTLNQINLSLNAGSGGMGIGIATTNFDVADNFEDLIFEISDLDEKPVPIVRIAPIYPSSLKKSRISGRVTVIFIVDESGNVMRPRIEKSAHAAFSQSALTAVQGWKFEAGKKDGKSVKTRMRLPLSFGIKNA